MHRVELGRFMVPVYQLIFHGRVSLPWLNGILSLCWLSISVWLTASIFSITDKVRICLLAGIFTVNITVTALTATYIHDLDADMFAVMLAVGMVFLWQKGRRSAWLGIPLLTLVLGFYQSMLSVSIALIMFASILALLQGEKAAKVVQKGLQAIAVILIAGVIYLCAVKLSCRIAGTELSESYNGLTSLFQEKGTMSDQIKLLAEAYYSWLSVFFHSSRTLLEMLVLHMLLAIPTLIAVALSLRKKELSAQNKILALVLGALLPLGMNISYVLSGGLVHDLMLYAAWLTYLLTILLTDWQTFSTKTPQRLPRMCSRVTIVVLTIILVAAVQTANSAYVKKDLERQATLSVMTMVSAEMNATEGYVAGETETIFVGTPQTGTDELFPYLSRITGLSHTSPITYSETYSSYFNYFLQAPIRLSKCEVPEEFIDSMAAFPEEGSIQWHEGVLVVKLSD